MEAKKGTTTLGIIFKDGVVLAADRQSTSFYIESRMEQKIYPITSHIAVTTSGLVADLQYLVRLLRAEAKLFEVDGRRMSVKALATLLSNILHAYKFFPMIVGMVIGGFDTEPRLYSIDPVGGLGSGEGFFSTGSGSPLAIGVLESEYREGMSEEEAINLAKKAMKAAIARDVYTGGRKIDIAVIDANGFRWVE